MRIIQKPELVFVCMAVFFGLLSAIFMPILETPDENYHFRTAYAMLSSSKKVPNDINMKDGMVLSRIKDSGNYSNYFTEKTSAQYDGYAINTDAYELRGRSIPRIVDIMHLPQSIGIALGRLVYPSLGTMVLLGRLFNLATFATAVYFIIKKIRYGKWTLFFVASLPIIIQQASSLSYDAVNLIAIFAWFAFIVNLFAQNKPLNKKQLLRGILLFLFLFMTKSNNLLLGALLFALPSKIIINKHILSRVKSSKYYQLVKVTGIILLGAIICAACFVLFKSLLGDQAFHPYKLLRVLLNTFMLGDLSLIDATVNGMVGAFGNFYYHIPFWITIITFTIFAIVLLYEKLPKVSKRFAIISGLLFVSSVLFISVGMYYSWAILPRRLGLTAEVTDGIQGRYFTPLLILLFPTFAYLQKYIKVTTKSRSTIPILATGMTVFLLILYISQTCLYFWI